LSQTIQVSNCTSETTSCQQCLSAVANGSPCMWCYEQYVGGYCDVSTATCQTNYVAATSCTPNCVNVTASDIKFSFFNYTLLSTVTQQYQPGCVGASYTCPFPMSDPASLSLNNIVSSLQYTPGNVALDPWVNFNNMTCFQYGAVGGFFDLTNEAQIGYCNGLLTSMRWALFLTPCNASAKLCPNISGCGQIATVCASVIASGCYMLPASGLHPYCANSTEECNPDIEYDPKQALCTAAPRLLSCAGAINIGCTVCNNSFSSAAGLSAFAQPVCPYSYFPYNQLNITDCNNLPETCGPVSTYASAAEVNFPTGFMTSSSYCYNVSAPTPAPPSNGTASPYIPVCYDETTLQCNVSSACREAFYAFSTYLGCAPCNGMQNHQLNFDTVCIVLAANCVPFISTCDPTSYFVKQVAMFASILPVVCTQQGDTTSGFMDGLTLTAAGQAYVEAGCANAPVPSTLPAGSSSTSSAGSSSTTSSGAGSSTTSSAGSSSTSSGAGSSTSASGSSTSTSSTSTTTGSKPTTTPPTPSPTTSNFSARNVYSVLAILLTVMAFAIAF